ncbi:lamin tail domain-containing protein [Actinomadura kijaniata]|uniref:LTD domain-containing protein n=1 Tax=Actinomadura namibiensis TaxID=182080 RepID=A0A7W3QKY9_ACTNM|nr:lamin tail domain-containing protein [Actinomadura namibiensis]MBA8950907.1 hypothetical protein [Actinomadura namibiensis]
MKKILATGAAVVGVLGLAAVPAEAGSAAAPGVQIRRVQYDSPGPDRGTNRSLNAEWVEIHNYSRHTRQLRGYTLRDRTGYTYTFRWFRLRPHRSVFVHTGRGHDDRRHVYWDRRWYVWNNDSDTATLRNRRGGLVDRCSWHDRHHPQHQGGWIWC